MIEAISGTLPSQPIAGERQAAPATQEVARTELPAQGMSQASLRAVEDAMRSANPPVLANSDRLSIVRDEETGTFIYRSIDRETGKVTRQWPVESMLQFKAFIREYAGVAVDYFA